MINENLAMELNSLAVTVKSLIRTIETKHTIMYGEKYYASLSYVADLMEKKTEELQGIAGIGEEPNPTQTMKANPTQTLPASREGLKKEESKLDVKAKDGYTHRVPKHRFN